MPLMHHYFTRSCYCRISNRSASFRFARQRYAYPKKIVQQLKAVCSCVHTIIKKFNTKGNIGSKKKSVSLIGYTQPVSSMLLLQMIRMPINRTLKMRILRKFRFKQLQKRLVHVIKLLLHVYVKINRNVILGLDATLIKKRSCYFHSARQWGTVVG